MNEREKEREVVTVGMTRCEGHCFYYWWKLIEEFSALIFPWQCSLALLAEVDGREGSVWKCRK
jgi:hypothetical protein